MCLGRAQRPPARLALQQPAQQVRAGDASRVHALRSTGDQHPRDSLELLLADDGREGVLHAHRGHVILRLRPPHQRARVHLVAEHPVDRGLQPLRPERARHAVCVERLGDVQRRGTVQGHVEHAAHHGIGGWVQLELGPLLHAVLDVHLPVAVGGEGGHPESARRGLPHPPQDFLRKVLTVELVHALDDGLHELAGRSVVGVLGDGDDADALLAEHGLEGHRVFALAREPAELPDEDHLEGRVGPAALVDHAAELGPVCDASALGLVDVLADDDKTVALGVLAESSKLGGDGEVDVLPVAGDAGVDGCGCEVLSFGHGEGLLSSLVLGLCVAQCDPYRLMVWPSGCHVNGQVSYEASVRWHDRCDSGASLGWMARFWRPPPGRSRSCSATPERSAAESKHPSGHGLSRLSVRYNVGADEISTSRTRDTTSPSPSGCPT